MENNESRLTSNETIAGVGVPHFLSIVGKTIREVKQIETTTSEIGRSQGMSEGMAYGSRGVTKTTVIYFTDGSQIEI